MGEKYNIKDRGYIYFISNESNSLIKIGRSRHYPDIRLMSIQTMCPVKLKIIATQRCNNHIEQEKYFHNIFKDYRKHSEWFDITKRMVLDEIAIFKKKNYIVKRNYDKTPKPWRTQEVPSNCTVAVINLAV